ncbi:MAG: CBS domain-containing protein, partial [Myxococcales bacterium]|nr:CBS domain-containing protein [Myxococcales bacterium]
MVDHPCQDWDESYFDRPRERRTSGFDAELLREPLTVLPVKRAVTLGMDASVTEAMRLMQREHCGCVLITDEGSPRSKLAGIFTERDVLFRIVDKGRNPAALPVGEVMTANPEALPMEANIAYVLNKMSVGGFRHIPVVDNEHRPVLVISVRDVVNFLVE